MKRFSISRKLYIFVITTVIFAVAGVSALSFIINVNQIDSYFKRLTINSANAYASYIDVEFIKELRKVAESDEFQAIRKEAESIDDDTAVVEYLKQKGLWEGYEKQRNDMIRFVNNMQDVEYLYLVAMGSNEENLDMYIMDADDVPFYETGYFEVREDEFKNVDMQGIIQPVISDGDWGLLCSGYVPVYDENNNLVCHVGCDISMEEIAAQRRLNLYYMVVSAVACIVVILALAFIFVRLNIINPLVYLTKEMKKFNPGENKSYEDSGVLSLDIKSNDEIQDISEEIHMMQTRIVDYLNSITVIKRDKERAEDEVKQKESQLNMISIEANKDTLTGVGNKNAYIKKSKDIEKELIKQGESYAVVMVDVNRLKYTNDNYGHSCGDIYLKGCCHYICNIFKHSPVFRVGGDEFVAILYGDDYLYRNERVEELRNAFDKSFRDTSVDPWLRYSASVGIAEKESESDTIDILFKKADEKMYEEKMNFKKSNGL